MYEEVNTVPWGNLTEEDRRSFKQEIISKWCDKSSSEINEHIDLLISDICSGKMDEVFIEFCKVEATVCADIVLRRG